MFPWISCPGSKMYFLLLSLALLVLQVQAEDAINQFNMLPLDIPLSVSTNITWSIKPATFLIGLYIRQVQDNSIPIPVQLPLEDCTDEHRLKFDVCTLWKNNGVAIFGGPSYSSLGTLVSGELYLFRLDWVFQGAINSSLSHQFGIIPINSSDQAATASTSSSTRPTFSHLSTLATSSTPASVTTAQSSTLTPSPTNPTSPSSGVTVATPVYAKSTKKSLSTGAIIGIAIGGAALILIILIAILLWRRHRNRQPKPTPKEIYPEGPYADSPSPVLAMQKQASYATRELSGPAAYTQQQQNYPMTTRDPNQNQDQNQNHIPPHIPTPMPAVPQYTPHPNLNPTPEAQQPIVPLIPQATPRPPSQGSSRFVPSRPPSIDEERAMSPEEMARLEDEERRIDEAIRESERARGVAGRGLGS